MAKIEMVTISNFMEKQVNVSNVVGIHQKNERNDVMAIQALLHLVGFSDTFSHNLIGLPKAELPEITGIFCTKTLQAVASFQRKMAANLLSVDGKIHPGKYKDRKIKVKKGNNTKYMTITLLNMYATDGSLHLFSTDLINAVRKIAPNLIYETIC